MFQSLKIFLKKYMPTRAYSEYAVLRRAWLRFFYRGNKYLCPLCRHHYRKFMPAGSSLPVWKEKHIVGGYRENALCPYCHSVERERMIYMYLADETDIFTNSKKIRLLHIAPENNLSVALRNAPGIDYLSGDISLDRVTAMEKIDITDIRYPDNSFDVIICSHVLEHVLEDKKAMREFYRVLKPGGWAILQVPVSLSLEKTFEDSAIVSPEERERVFGQFDHVRIYAKDDYKNRLECAGFAVRVYTPEKEKGRKYATRYAFQKNEDIYLCTKPLLSAPR